MTKQTIYYLGPENTFSHAVAQEAQAQLPNWRDVRLEPCSSATDIFTKLQNNPEAGAIAPVFNLEQGVVHDFTRFYLFQPIWEHKLYVKLSLYSQAESLEQITKIITKDTVVPQVSRWLDTLPSHIEIEATPYISTAASAKQAAEDPQVAAICSPKAGQAYTNLHPLKQNLSNNQDSYTLFKLFTRPDTYWSDPQLFPAPEHPHNMTPSLARQLRAGECRVRWHKSTRTSLHLGHYSNLLTLRKLAQWGNRIEIVWGTQNNGKVEVELLQTAVRQFLGSNALIEFLTQGEKGLIPTADVVVAGVEHIHAHSDQPAILVDMLPGTDGYAKMDTSRGNTVPWLQSEGLLKLPPLLTSHFSTTRLVQVGLSIPS